jgi:predicted  nucleic acid-binding Zn-ribbon protein
MSSAHDLLELQDLDISLHRNAAALKQIPEAAQIIDVRARLKELARRTTRINGLLKDQQMELEDGRAEHAELVERCELIQRDSEGADYRQQRKSGAELDNIAKRLEKLEFNDGKISQEIERLQGLQKKSEQVRGALVERERELLDSFRDKAQGLRDDEVHLKERRAELVGSMPADLVKRYDESCARHGGIGVCHLEGKVCSGCGVELQTSQVDELRAGDAVSLCPVCGRMLVVRE